MDTRIKKGITQLKKISLTSEEKSKMLSNLSVYADLHLPISPVHSLYSFFSISMSRKLAYAIISVVITVMLGGTVAYASEQSLPGELFYPIKTKIIEPVKTALALTPKDKAEVKTEIIDNRLNEAEVLDNMGKLTPKLGKELDDKIKSNISDFYKIKKQIGKNNSSSSIEENDKIQKAFDMEMSAHVKMIDKFKKNFGDPSKLESKDNERNDKSQENSKIKGVKYIKE